MSEPLDFRQLRAFVAVVEQEGFTSAAAHLGLTQSAVSHAIAALQDNLGCSLFFKVGKKSHLTRQGEMLHEKAVMLLRMESQIRAKMAAFDEVDRGTLRVVCTASAAQFLLPPVLREFRECFERYTIRVQTADTPEIVKMLETNAVHIGLGVLPPDASGYGSRELFRDKLAYFVGPSHPWYAMRHAPKDGLADATYLIYPRGSLTHQLFEDHLLRLGGRLRSSIELASVEAIRELAKIGVGVAVLAEWIVRDDLASGTLKMLPIRPAIPRRWATFWLKPRPLNLAEQTFVGLCEAVGKACVSGRRKN